VERLRACPADGTALRELAAPIRDPLQQRVLEGRYRLEGKVGEGGMGLVYRATRLQDGATVAIKILVERSGARANEDRKRFQREAQLLSQLNHPNLVALLDAGQADGGLLYLVMEYLEGRTLHEVVPDAGTGAEAAAAIMEEVCAALGAAHKAGVVHRDLKPENVFIARQRDGSHVVKVIDFGLAKAMETDESSRLTMTGKVVGSAGFIAPEHILGSREFTPASDIYALGGILFYMLTGHRPYAGESVAQVMEAQVKEKPPALGLPAGHEALVLEYTVRRAMSRKPEKRFSSTRDMQVSLQHAMKVLQRRRTPTLTLNGMTVVRRALTSGTQARKQVLAAGAGVLVGLAALGAFWLLSQ